MLIFQSRSLFLRWVRPLFADEPLQLSLPDKGFNLLLQVVTINCVMAVITVEAAVLAKKCKSPYVFDLHQDLVDQGNQRDETCEFSRGGFGVPVLPPFSSPSYLCPLSCHTSSYLFLFLGLSSRANNASSAFMYFVACIAHLT